MNTNQQISDNSLNQNKDLISNKLICKICGKECNKFYGLSSHVVKKHNIKSKEYYDKYLKKESEGICLTCRKETKFCRISCGYYKYCSCKCKANNLKLKEEKRKTCFKKYGGPSPCSSGKIKENRKHTCLKKYGETTNLKTKENKELVRQTYLKKYGVDHYSKTIAGREILRLKMEERLETKFPNGQKMKCNEGKNETEILDRLENSDSEKILRHQCIGGLYPDGIGEKLPFIIEIDEKYHEEIRAKKHDKIKDEYYISKGYIPLRIKESDWFEDKELQIIKFQETIKFLKQAQQMYHQN